MPISEMTVRGNQSVCKADVSSYRSLQNRWKTQRSLKTWWDNKSESDKVEWYRAQQKHERGQKRNFDSITYEETSFKETVQNDMEADNWVPINVFIRLRFAEGVNRTTAIAEFSHLLHTGQGSPT